MSKPCISSIAALAFLAGIGQAMAAEPTVKTLGAIIYLADNLDEEADLGWCIDTVGRGLSDKLHAHSCKPANDGTALDVNFAFDPDSGHIRSVAFEGKCMALSMPENEAIPFGLIDCADDAAQSFAFDADTGQIRPATDATSCVAVSPTSRKAGPFMSRDLRLYPCAGTMPVLTTWRIRPDQRQ